MIRGKYWQVARTDVMPNWYIAAEGMKPYVIENTEGDDLDFVRPFNRPNKWKRFPNDQFNPYSPRIRYDINKDVVDYGRSIKPVIPTPQLYKDLDKNIMVHPRNWVVLESMDFPKESKLVSGMNI